MANGDSNLALKQLCEDIDRYLGRTDLDEKERMQMGILRQCMPFIQQAQDDHKAVTDLTDRVEKIEPWISAAKWAGAVLTTLNIGTLWAWLTHSGPFAAK